MSAANLPSDAVHDMRLSELFISRSHSRRLAVSSGPYRRFRLDIIRRRHIEVRNPMARRITAGLLFTALLGAACGNADTDPSSSGEQNSPSDSGRDVFLPG